MVLEQYNTTSNGTTKWSILPHSNYGEEGAFNAAFEHITQVLQKIVELSLRNVLTDESTENLTLWKSRFSSYASELSLEPLCTDVLKAVYFAVCIIFNSFPF